MRTYLTEKICKFFALCCVLIITNNYSFGQILWSSSGGSAWLTGSNWTGSAVPTASQIAQFGANPTGTAGVGITFSSTTNAGTQTNGNRIEDAAAVEITSSRASSFLIGNSSSTAGATGRFRLLGTTVNSNANTILRNNSSQLFTIQNTQGSGTQAMDLVLGNSTNNNIYIDGTGGIAISSIIQDAGNSYKLSLLGSGTGALTLSGANTFTGGVTMASGTSLNINSTSALGTIAGTFTINGGTIDNTSGGSITTSNYPITVGGNFAFTGTNALNVGTGAVALGSSTSRTITNNGTNNLTIGGIISGTSSSLSTSIASTGNIILTGVNTYTGGTTVDGTGAGQLQIGTVGALPTTGTITVTNGGGLRLNITGTHGGSSQSISLTPNQSTNPVLDCGNFSATLQGNISLSPSSGSIVRVEANGASSVFTLSGNISGTGLLQKQADGTLVLSGTNNTYSGGTRVGFGTVTVNSGSSIGTGLLNMYQFGSTANTLNLNNSAQTVSSLSSSYTGSLVAGTPYTNTINLGSGHTLTINQSSNTTYGVGTSSTFRSILAGSGNIVKSGTGTLTLSGIDNTYTGSTTINAGTLSVSTLANGGTNSSIGASTNAAANLVLGGGVLQYTGATVSTDRNFTLTASTSDTIDVTTNTLTISGASTATSGSLTKTGSGILVLTGANLYTGSTTATAGTLQLNRTGGTTIPATNNCTINGGTLRISTNQTVNNLSISSGTLTVDAGVTLTINGTLTYSGGTISSTGTIVYGSSGALSIGATKSTGIEWTASNTPASVTITAGVYTLGNAATTSGDLTISGTAYIVGTGFTLTVGGNWNSTSAATPTNGSGGYSHGANASSIVILNGSGSKTFAHTNGAIFRNLQITGTGTYTSDNDITISVNTLTISSGGLDMSTSSLSGTGGLTMSSGTLSLAKLSATLPELAGTYNITGGTVSINGSGAQTINGTPNYVNLSVGGSGTKTPSSATAVSGTLAISGSAILDGSISSKLVSGYTTLNMTNSSTFKVGGSSTQPPASSYSLASTSTIQFDGSSSPTIRNSGVTYANVIINNSNVSTGSGGISITSGCSFTVNSGVTLNVNQSNGLYSGSSNAFVNGSGNTITLTGSTINYSGTSQVITPSLTYNNLTISGSGTKTAAASFTVNGTFTQAGSAILGTTSPIYGSGATLAYVDATASQSYTSGLEWPASSSPANITVNLSGTGTTLVTLATDKTISGALTLTAGKLSIASNTLTLNGTATSMSANNSLRGSTFSKLNIISTSGVGTLYFDQTTSADAGTTTGTNALQNLVISGSGGSVTLGNKVNLFERLSVSDGTLNTGDVLVLRSISGSSSNNTAYVDQVGGTINGQVTVERYVHKQSQGWRAITAPVTYNGISQGYVSGNWQSNFGYSGNYGTRITGPSATNGLDDVTVSASLMTYNSTSGAWNKIANTTTETVSGANGNADNKGFFLFVRGDRTVTPNGYNPNAFVATTLAAKGKLQTGTQTFTYGGAANKAWLIGNPYACPVDMSAVTFNGSIPNFVYVWDPNRPSSYSGVTGAYVTFDRTTWGAPTAGSTTKYFQSGECFFIVPTSGSGVNVVFNESNKNTSNQNNQTAGSDNGLSDEFNIKLSYIKADGSRAEIDGVRAKYGSSYNAAVDAEDAYKWSSADIENMSLARNNSNLVIEARPYITGTDSLFLNITNLSIGSNYELKLNPINFDASVSSCKLVDKFLNTETPVSLTNTTLVGFNVTSVSGSNAANRFYVVFNATGNLPTSNSLTVKAYKQNNGVKIDWEAIAENNVKSYTVEKSTDAASFSKLSEATAKNGNTTNTYSIVDNNPVVGVNYYRIQSTATNNNKAYSAIVRVEMSDKGVKSITVYPNPVKSNSNTVGLQLNNLTAGSYTAVLYNAAGQQVWLNTMNHNGSNGSTSLQLNKTLASGTYQLQLTDTKGNSYKQTVLVVE